MTLTVLVAIPLEQSLIDRVAATHPRVHLIHAPELPARRAGLLGGADVALGVGDSGPHALHRFTALGQRLRWVQGISAGFGESVVLLPDDVRRRVAFTSARGLHGRQLAEFTVLVLLAFTKDLNRWRVDQAARHWAERPVGELLGQHVVVVGLGHVGLTVARLCHGLGMRVTGVNRNADATGPMPDHLQRVVPLSELPKILPAADALVLALPGTGGTRGLLSRSLIAALPPRAVVVNVGRGSAVDEPALVEALTEHRIAGAGLDVFQIEPLPADSPLWTLDNVVLSPHTASMSVTESSRLVDLFCENLRRYLAGEALLNLIGPRGEHLPGDRSACHQ